MGEYGRENREVQSKKLLPIKDNNKSYFIDNRLSYVKQGQLLDVIVNRLPKIVFQLKYNNAIQKQEDLSMSDARILSFLRYECEKKLWVDDAVNFEVQVEMHKEESGDVLVIGYNIGGTNAPPNGTINKEYLNELLYKQFPTLRGVWISKINIVKRGSINPDQGKSVHAEQMIILTEINKMLDIIEKGNPLVHRDIYIRGKKYTCQSCHGFIDTLDKNVFVNRFLTIHTPSKKVFNQTKHKGDSEATSHGNVAAWENPLRTGLLPLDNIKAKIASIAEEKRRTEESEFVLALERLSQWSIK